MTPSTAPLQSPQDTIDIDRCGLLMAEKKRVDADPKWKELAALKSKMQDLAFNDPPDQPKRLTGATYYVDLTQCELKRVITNQPAAFRALVKAIGIRALVKRLKLTFTLLDAEIAPGDQAKYVTSSRTGSRDVSGGLLVTPVVPVVA